MREFLRGLYAHRAAYLLTRGYAPAEAKAEATALALAFKAALTDGTLIDLGEVSSGGGDFTKSALLSLREVIGQDGPVLGLRKEAGGGYEQLKLS